MESLELFWLNSVLIPPRDYCFYKNLTSRWVFISRRVFHFLEFCDIIRGMRLSKKFDRILILVVFCTMMLVFGCLYKVYSHNTFAEEGEESAVYDGAGAKFVTFYDSGEKLTIKTEARTVGEAIQRAGIIVNEGDIVDPGTDTEINADNYFVNIYRARPVVVWDGSVEKYLMTASYDAKAIAKEAGITVYDGDEVKLALNRDFLEVGVASRYELVRNGGRMVTEEVEIPFAEETVEDAGLELGKTEVRQLGEVGTKRITYNVYYVNNEEAARELVSEEVVREPVTRVTAVGTKHDVVPAVAVTGTCADWVRAAGVAEEDVAAALDIINRESGCRVNARNAYSGAYGIPQALPGNKMASAGADWETNPVTQIRWMASYVSRYGGWQGALNFWYAHGWY